MPSDDRPGLLILEAAIPSWMAFFEAARARGLEIYSTCAEESVAERGGYCAEVIRHTPNYFHNLDEIVKAVASLAGRRRIDGIVSPYEATTPVLAHAAAALDLPGPRVETCGALCNKQAMRAEFEKAGLPSPVSHPVASLDEARGAAEQIGYRVVIKPTAGAGSIGVTRVDNSDGLAGAFALVEQACETVHAPPEFLVEEFLRGPQLSVESITFKGETVWQGTTFVPHPMDGPHFPVHELITPSPLPPRTLEGLYALNERVNGVMGVHGVTHTEYRLTPQGPRLIELNPRPAGQNIPEMYQQVYGVDLVGAAIDCARGKRPEIEPPAGGGAGEALCRLSLPRSPCRQLHDQRHRSGRKSPRHHGHQDRRPVARHVTATRHADAKRVRVRQRSRLRRASRGASASS